MRAQIKDDSTEFTQRVIVREPPDPSCLRDCWYVTVYYASAKGGYVRTYGGRQVCYGLSDRGPTLYLHAGQRLIDLNRRERRRAKAAERRMAREWR